MYHLIEGAVAAGERTAALTLEAVDAQDAQRDWIAGHAFEAPPLQPLRLRASARPGTMLPALRQTPVPLMTRALHAAMCEAGVANIDVYAAQIVDADGCLLSDEHLAFNVVGTLRSGPPCDGARLTTVRLNAAGAGSLLLFRVVDAPYALVATRLLRRRLPPQALAQLRFTRAAEWAG
ncbi:conserved hypothetical protein [Rubrivivax sp. A210]|uniref:hypothetical protein n=1 Tax=Rubrivivax sp. A210 TaxID=2772301 RepID=UPI00191A8468|nr:hypothetical protein [Rubrivivax sp. A210]CAD5372898.1 conserved hypothetical protein [Rubrivivax sp. A210]